MPVTIPDDEPTAATEGVPLSQLPEPASVKETVAPVHTLSVPDIEDGSALIVTGNVREQPVGSV